MSSKPGAAGRSERACQKVAEIIYAASKEAWGFHPLQIRNNPFGCHHRGATGTAQYQQSLTV
jgi:hypothetical protein